MEQAKLYVDFLYGVGSFLSAADKDNLCVVCQFNPTALEISHGAKWDGDPIAERDFPRTEFGGGTSGSYNLELFFDAYADWKMIAPV